MHKRLVIDVTFTPNGTSETALTERLKSIAQNAAGDGSFTGDTAAEVETWSAVVHPVAKVEAPADFIPAHNALLSREELKSLAGLLVSHPDGTLAEQMLTRIAEASGAHLSEETRKGVGNYQSRADDLHGKDGEVEIDDGAIVSFGEDPGAYVQAWVWVPNEGADGED